MERKAKGMNNQILKPKRPIQPVRNLIGQSSSHYGTVAGLLIPLALGVLYFALSRQARAVCQEGCDGENTFLGEEALVSNTTGFRNTATGNLALFSNTTGFNNTATGSGALVTNTTGNNNIYIGNLGIRSESGTIRLGTKETHRNTLIAGISGATVPTGVAVIVDGNGHLGTTTSSARFKASEAILALQPVTFRYKKDLDPKGIPQFGLVAEQVEKVDPDLVARDEQGKPYSVRYEAVNAMLLNKSLREHRKVEKLEASVAQQQEQIQALTSGLQKVGAQLENEHTCAANHRQ